MKILFLTDQTYLHGGVEKVLSIKANYFTEQGNEVCIFTTEQKNKLPVYNLSERIKCIDFSINYTREKSYFHPSNLLRAYTHYRKLKKNIQELKPEVIISSNYSFDFYFLPFIAPQIPKIKEFHSTQYREHHHASIKEKFMKFLDRWAQKRYHQLVVLNNAEKDYFASEKVTVIPNPIETIEKKFKEESKILLAAGRLSPVKNFGELIEIAKEVFTTFDDWQLHIYGDDYCGTKEKLQNKIKKYNLENTVKIFSATQDFSSVLENAGIYVMTSHQECFPMVLLESLGLGIPIVSYNAPHGPQYILADKKYLIDNGNRKDFIEKLRILMNSNEIRETYSQNSIKFAEKFTKHEIMKQWVSLFNALKNV